MEEPRIPTEAKEEEDLLVFKRTFQFPSRLVPTFRTKIKPCKTSFSQISSLSDESDPGVNPPLEIPMREDEFDVGRKGDENGSMGDSMKRPLEKLDLEEKKSLLKSIVEKNPNLNIIKKPGFYLLRIKMNKKQISAKFKNIEDARVQRNKYLLMCMEDDPKFVSHMKRRNSISIHNKLRFRIPKRGRT